MDFKFTKFGSVFKPIDHYDPILAEMAAMSSFRGLKVEETDTFPQKNMVPATFGLERRSYQMEDFLRETASKVIATVHASYVPKIEKFINCVAKEKGTLEGYKFGTVLRAGWVQGNPKNIRSGRSNVTLEMLFNQKGWEKVRSVLNRIKSLFHQPELEVGRGVLQYTFAQVRTAVEIGMAGDTVYFHGYYVSEVNTPVEESRMLRVGAGFDFEFTLFYHAQPVKRGKTTRYILVPTRVSVGPASAKSIYFEVTPREKKIKAIYNLARRYDMVGKEGQDVIDLIVNKKAGSLLSGGVLFGGLVVTPEEGAEGGDDVDAYLRYWETGTEEEETKSSGKKAPFRVLAAYVRPMAIIARALSDSLIERFRGRVTDRHGLLDALRKEAEKLGIKCKLT